MKLAPIILNNENISGLMGSISIACWVIVFVPQIYENFYRSSAEGLSLLFIILWLAGDVFNLVGAMMQHLLMTMIILAAYYTIADIILLIQCLWYDRAADPMLNVDEINDIDPIHFSPATPMNENVLQDVFSEHQPLLVKRGSNPSAYNSLHQHIQQEQGSSEQQEQQAEQEEEVLVETLDKGNYLSDAIIVSLVIFAGFASWYIPYCKRYYNNNIITESSTSTFTITSRFSMMSHHHRIPHGGSEVDEIEVNLLAQFFGYLSAVLYLGSRIPQILLNFKRKSCEGISFLFFLFACLGNTTFITSVVSISLDPKYLLVNASWLVGSSGTLIMDFIIFCQFFLYGRGPVEKSTSEQQDV